VRGLLVGIFDWAEQWVRRAFVRNGVFEDSHDHACLVNGGDRGVAPGAKRHVQQSVPDHRGNVEKPLGEERGPDVGDVQAGPVEDPLGKPVKFHGMAFRVLSGSLLRHIHDAVDARLDRGLGELGGSLDIPGLRG
jgi:hypothetical protein